MRKMVVLIASGMLFTTALGQETRPVRDDVGYCWDRASMQKLVEHLQGMETERFEAPNRVAAIFPHDDYLYAGRLYYPVFRTLKAREAVIIGLTHSAVKKEIGDPNHVIILDEYRTWPGLEKSIPVSGLRDFLKETLDPSVWISSNKAHNLEHSIEAALPFLHYYNPDIQITPIMVTAMPFVRMEEVSAKLAEAISEYMAQKNLRAGKDIFFLISSDGNHYGEDYGNLTFGEGEKAWKEALVFDRKMIGSYLTGAMDSPKVESLTREIWGETYRDWKNVVWCGKYSIPFGLLTVETIIDRTSHNTIRGTLLRFSDTVSEGVLPLEGTNLGTTGPFSLRHWVSFFSIGYDVK